MAWGNCPRYSLGTEVFMHCFNKQMILQARFAVRAMLWCTRHNVILLGTYPKVCWEGLDLDLRARQPVLERRRRLSQQKCILLNCCSPNSLNGIAFLSLNDEAALHIFCWHRIICNFWVETLPSTILPKMTWEWPDQSRPDGNSEPSCVPSRMLPYP